MKLPYSIKAGISEKASIVMVCMRKAKTPFGHTDYKPLLSKALTSLNVRNSLNSNTILYK